MIINFLLSAEQEFAEAVDYYNKQLAGLGFEFAAEVKYTLERILLYPNAWSPFSNRTRRCIINRFPYGILYQVRQDMILVMAIMHLKKSPIRWQERIKNQS